MPDNLEIPLISILVLIMIGTVGYGDFAPQSRTGEEDIVTKLSQACLG